MVVDLSPERTTIGDAEVSRIGAWPVWVNAVRLFSAYLEAQEQVAEVKALGELYTFFIGEAQPTWNVRDHRGPIQPTADGMWRLPLQWALPLIEAWIDTIPKEPPPSAVDAVVPPGKLRDDLNAGLRKKRHG